MRKFLAVFFTVITFAAIAEGVRMLTSSAKDVASQRPILLVIAISIILPLLLLSLWLWRPRKKNPKNF